jgi:hypothetical protein
MLVDGERGIKLGGLRASDICGGDLPDTARWEVGIKGCGWATGMSAQGCTGRWTGVMQDGEGRTRDRERAGGEKGRRGKGTGRGKKLRGTIEGAA